jgi:hypothetical protein
MNKIQIALKQRYPEIHPLLFQRSLEKARTDVELFDILEGMPSDFPLVWDDDNYCWKKTEDLLQGKFRKKEE